MSTETMTATAILHTSTEDVFAVLADPARHPAIDGTGWLTKALDGERLTEVGQVFGMAMYHENHPEGAYEMANKVTVLDPPRAVAWKPGQYDADGKLGLGGWSWRYDLRPVGGTRTEVTLTYDWSAVSAELRKVIQFPPFGQNHLDRSLHNLGALASQ